MNSKEFSLAGNESQSALDQVMALVAQALDMNIKSYGRQDSFTAEAKQARDGIQSVTGRLTDQGMILLQMELMTARAGLRMAIDPLFDQMSQLGEKVHIVQPEIDAQTGMIRYSIGLLVQAVPLSFSRANALTGEVKRLDELARNLRQELPEIVSDGKLVDVYKKCADLLAPVFPVKNFAPEYDGWIEQTSEMLKGSLSIALAVEDPVSEQYSLALLASGLSSVNWSLGRYLPAALPAKGIIEVAQKAPGLIVVSAMRIQIAANIYELSNDMQSALLALQQINKPVLFSGSFSQLQSLFHGGQGGINDPLLPVVVHAPQFDISVLTSFCVDWCALEQGGLSAREKQTILHRALSVLQMQPVESQKRLLLTTVRREMRNLANRAGKASGAEFVQTVSDLSETLSGLSHKPRGGRSRHVQDRFTRNLLDPDLLDYFKEHLFAQDSALEQLVGRLQMECLTRPVWQPFRYCAQGTPATGKSESAVLLAQRLEVPYINFDAASIPDFYIASAQLLGSGRGIVGSHQSGRLEQAAKHHIGAVIEISDLDHAVPQVRSALGDLFLQVLETGEAQSASGAMFSCANLIFAFTINLPDGLDENVRKGLGFNNDPSETEVQKRVSTEIKRTFSSAFLSRIGTPILFEPLSGDALAVIVERIITNSIKTSAERTGLEIDSLHLAKGLGVKVMNTLEASLLSYGARAIIEHGRNLAAQAFIDWLRQNHRNSRSLTVRFENNKLLLDASH